MRLLIAVEFSFLLMAASSVAQQVSATKPLLIYVIDVEGGNAVLFVSPSGQSLLMDTGNLKAPRRDASRIMDAIKDAGVQRIDHLLTTHWHLDHFGGMVELAKLIPIREFIDHGANIQPKPEVDSFLSQTYPQLYSTAKHRVVKPGDTIPFDTVDVRVVASAGETIKSSLLGGGQINPYCPSSNMERVDRTENGQSIGIVMTYGSFRLLHLGDLSSDKEFELMCPNNRIGTADLFVVSHHGQPHSNTAALVNAIESRAAIMNNGTGKGGEPDVMKILHSAPGMEDLWQLHFSELSGQEYTAPGMFIANLTDNPRPFVQIAPIPESKLGKRERRALVHDGTAYWMEVSARADGSFTIVNERNGFSKTYRERRK